MEEMIDACETKGIVSPVLFTDSVTPDFQTASVQITEFELRGRWRDYRDSGHLDLSRRGGIALPGA